MKRLLCQSLYSNISKNLALHGPRTIVTEENSDFVYCQSRGGGGRVTSTHNKRGCAILTAKVASKNPGTYLKLRPKNPETFIFLDNYFFS